MIRWVFFDVGNLIYNDHEQGYYGYKCLYERVKALHPDWTFERILERREEHARACKTWILLEIARALLPEDEAKALYPSVREHLLPNYDSYHRTNEGVREALETLQGRYRLGIIANQPPECRGSLERRELLRFFDVVAISEELDLHKPDVQLFRWALEQAGCEGHEAVMIGDRLDNDVAPARELGMRTILVDWPQRDGGCWRPDDAQALAFLASCARVPYFNGAASEVQPDRTVASFAEIPAAVNSIAGELA